MNLIIVVLTSIFPRQLQNLILNIFGNDIHPNAKIAFGAIVKARKITMKKNATVGSFSVVYCQTIEMGEYSKLGGLCLSKCGHIKMKDYSKISPLSIINSSCLDKAVLELGVHSQIFPFCWIEPGEGVYIGDDSGIGGHTLIFTHGAWSDYLRQGPVKYAPVKIGNHVWLPWRVFIMPGVTIHDDSIVAAGSVLSRDVEKGSLVAGMPAKKVKDGLIAEMSVEDRKLKAKDIIDSYFQNFDNKKCSIKVELEDSMNRNDIFFAVDKLDDTQISIAKQKGISILDYTNKRYIDSSNSKDLDFYSFVRNYGIRLSLAQA